VAIGAIAPPKTHESSVFHHEFLQLGKTLDCQLTLDCQILLKSPPLNLRAGSALAKTDAINRYTNTSAASEIKDAMTVDTFRYHLGTNMERRNHSLRWFIYIKVQAYMCDSLCSYRQK